MIRKMSELLGVEVRRGIALFLGWQPLCQELRVKNKEKGAQFFQKQMYLPSLWTPTPSMYVTMWLRDDAFSPEENIFRLITSSTSRWKYSMGYRDSVGFAPISILKVYDFWNDLWKMDVTLRKLIWGLSKDFQDKHPSKSLTEVYWNKISQWIKTLLIAAMNSSILTYVQVFTLGM